MQVHLTQHDAEEAETVKIIKMGLALYALGLRDEPDYRIIEAWRLRASHHRRITVLESDHVEIFNQAGNRVFSYHFGNPYERNEVCIYDRYIVVNDSIEGEYVFPKTNRLKA